MSKEYSEKLGIIPVECSCDICASMCVAPCCPSVEDAEKLIDAGYGDRLMFDDLQSIYDGGDLLKPALKGYEGTRAPWQTSSPDGCTFWKDGKCELHDLGLKPILGKLAYHEERIDYDLYAEISKEDWESARGLAVIAKWKKQVDYE